MIKFHVTKIKLQKKKNAHQRRLNGHNVLPLRDRMITACGLHAISCRLLTIAGTKTLQTARVVSDSTVPLPHGTGPIPQCGTRPSTKAEHQAKEDMCSSCGEQLWPVVVYVLIFCQSAETRVYIIHTTNREMSLTHTPTHTHIHTKGQFRITRRRKLEYLEGTHMDTRRTSKPHTESVPGPSCCGADHCTNTPMGNTLSISNKITPVTGWSGWRSCRLPLFWCVMQGLFPVHWGKGRNHYSWHADVCFWGERSL